LKILVIGLAYFSKKISDELNKFDKKNKYLSIDVNKNLISRLLFILMLPFSKVVYSIGGSICPRKIFSFALNMKKKVIMHWVGSDVLHAEKDLLENKTDERMIKEVTHFCEAEWIKKELRELRIDSSIVQFATVQFAAIQSATIQFAASGNNDSVNDSLPDKFSILTYIPENKEEFYGINKIIKLAGDFPCIQIKIAGISKYPADLPSNIALLGYVIDMNEEYKKSVLYLRLIEHDGLSFSVLEALSNGRYVGYSEKVPGCFFINNYHQLKKTVSSLKLKFDKNKLKMNSEGLKYIRKKFIREKILSKLISEIIK
jgi:hypothetical protein